MKKKIVYLAMFAMANFSLAVAQNYIVADDVYYQKGDELLDVVVEEEVPDTDYNVLILEPEVRNYEEGVIIYKTDEGKNDTVYIYGDSDYYLNQ